MLEVVGVMRNLTGSTDGQVGGASFFELDINSRVRSFYFSLFFLAASTGGINYLLSIIKKSKQSKFVQPSWTILEFVSMFGCLFILFYALRHPIPQSLVLAMDMFFVYGLIVTIQMLFKFRALPYKQSLWVSLISFCLAFLISDFAIGLSGMKLWHLSFVSFQLIGYALMYFVGSRVLFTRMVLYSMPIAALPLVPFLSDETFLILANRSIESFSTTQLTLLYTFIISFIAFLRWLYLRNKTHFDTKLSFHSYYVLIIIGVSCLSSLSWQVSLQPWSTESFEMGNPQLAVYKFHEYGLIPFLESFNSHALSEIIDSFLFTSLNGYHGDFSMFNYVIIQSILIGLSTYFLLKKIIQSAHIAFISVLIIPILFFVIDYNYSIIWFGVLALFNAINKKTLISYALFWLCFALSALWTIDQGVLFILASIIMMGMMVYLKIVNKTDLKPGVMGLGIIILLFLTPTLIIVFVKDIDLLGNFMLVWKYISSHQSWGYRGLGLMDATFMLHYILFPICGLFGLGYVFWKKDLLFNKTGQNRFVPFLFVFAIVATFCNVHRGLDRHSFAELSDYISGFMYLAFAIAIWYLLRNKKLVYSYFLITLSVSMLLMGFKYPAYKSLPSIYEQGSQKLDQYAHLNISKATNRGNSIMEQVVAKKYPNLQFFDKFLLKGDQSFLEFGNMPMLYYYFKRPVPSYFAQTLASAHNFELQYDYVERCKQADLPYATLSNEHFGFDIDFPNELRHPMIADYLFANYKPMGILDSISIWVRNEDWVNVQMPDLMKEIDDSQLMNDSNGVIYGEKAIRDNILTLKAYFGTSFPKPIPGLQVLINDTLLLPASFVNNRYKMAFFQIENCDSIHKLTFFLKGSRIATSKIQFYESEYTLDYYHETPEHYFLGMVPHYQANYEYDIEQEFTDQTGLIQTEQDTWDFLKGDHIPIPESFQTNRSNAFLYFNISPIKKDMHPKRGVKLTVEFGNEKEGINGQMQILLSPRQEPKYLTRISAQYNWQLKKNTWIRFKDIPGGYILSDPTLMRLKEDIRK